MKLYNKKVVFQMNLTMTIHMHKKVKFFLKNGYINVVASVSHRVGDRGYEVSKYLKN